MENQQEHTEDYTTEQKYVPTFKDRIEVFKGGFWVFKFYLWSFIHGGTWAVDLEDPENPIYVWSHHTFEYYNEEKAWWRIYDFMNHK